MTSELTASHSFVASDGQRLGYRIRGHGRRIICVPGGPGRASTYFDDLGGLDADAELVFFDVRGSGLSRPADPATLTVQRLVEDLEELRQHLGESAPILLGHSFGCRVLAEYAVAHPNVVRALLMLTPPPMWESASVADDRAAIVDIRAELPDLGPAVEAARALPAAAPRDRSILEAMAVPLWYGSWDEESRAHAARAAAETPARTALTLRQSAMTTPVADFRSIPTPTLLVAGQLDYLSPPGPTHALHDRLPDSTYAEVEGAGHYPWLDEPVLLRALIRDFLDAIPSGV